VYLDTVSAATRVDVNDNQTKARTAVREPILVLGIIQAPATRSAKRCRSGRWSSMCLNAVSEKSSSACGGTSISAAIARTAWFAGDDELGLNADRVHAAALGEESLVVLLCLPVEILERSGLDLLEFIG
jgi:hypothetical protein